MLRANPEITAAPKGEGIQYVPIAPLSPERFRDLLGERFEDVVDAMVAARKLFAGRVNWHINSTARGGGVAELLQSLLAYARGAGVDSRWAVIEGNPEFFEITKRIHNNLHGFAGDGGELGDAERDIYERTLAANAASLARLIRRGDVVFLHDPQTAGLVGPIRKRGALVVWRCHVGLDLPNDLARRAWDFLRAYVEPADAVVFSRAEYAWDGLDPDRTWVIPPSIDAFSAKNQDLDPATVAAILATAGVQTGNGHPPVFLREDGTPCRVDGQAEMIQDRPLDPADPLVTQVSRWDRLKDPAGLLRAFTDHCSDIAHLLLAGPAVEAVSDDPEGLTVLREMKAHREALPQAVRERVHLACLPMGDIQENAAMVNAIQRRSQIVVQKSIAEGFGLTVVEAMWKARPVVASAVGGIRDQIADGESGVLVADPTDLDAFGLACRDLLENPDRAERMGAAARARVIERFLGPRHMMQYLTLMERLAGEPAKTAAA